MFTSLEVIIVGDLVLLDLVKVTVGVLVGSGHGNKVSSKVLLELDALPGVVDVIAVSPELRRLLRVELSAKDGVVLSFDRGGESCAVGHETLCCYIPELGKTFV